MNIFNFLLNRWVVLVLGAFFMLVGLKPDWVMKAVSITGKMWWAENRLGQGGTFTVWKIIGILAPIAAIIYFFSGGIQFDNPNVSDEPAGYDEGYTDYNF